MEVLSLDEKIAYLGSLNFTASGTKYNYETKIRTEDRNAVEEINKEFNELFNKCKLPEREIQAWGTQLYNEPIN